MVVVILYLAQMSGIRLPEVVVIVFASKHSCLGWPAHFLLVVPIKIIILCNVHDVIMMSHFPICFVEAQCIELVLA